MSLPEVVLWEELRSGRLSGLRFRRQHPIGPYVLDFYCAPMKLGVEVDGAAHGFADRARHDEHRDRWLTRQGIKLLRFSVADVMDDHSLGGVLMMIAEAAAGSSPAKRGRGTAEGGGGGE